MQIGVVMRGLSRVAGQHRVGFLRTCAALALVGAGCAGASSATRAPVTGDFALLVQDSSVVEASAEPTEQSSSTQPNSATTTGTESDALATNSITATNSATAINSVSHSGLVGSPNRVTPDIALTPTGPPITEVKVEDHDPTVEVSPSEDESATTTDPADDPEDASGAPGDVSDNLEKATDLPGDVSGDLENSSDNPDDVSDDLQNASGDTGDVSGDLENSSDNPDDVSDDLENASDNPDDVSDDLENASGDTGYASDDPSGYASDDADDPAGFVTGAQIMPDAATAMYFTFDDGPNPIYTPQVLEVLARHGAKATFFVLGSLAEQYPDLVERIVAEGHTVANHTWNHESLTGVSEETFNSTVGRTQELLGAYGTQCLRPPYGRFDASTEAWAQEHGLEIAKWNVDPKDWQQPPAAVIAESIVKHARAGAIVLLHDGGGNRSNTVRGLDLALERLADRDLSFTPMCRSGNPQPSPMNDIAWR